MSSAERATGRARAVRRSIRAGAARGVVAILSFLAALAALGGIAVSERAADWRDATAREATLQVVPQPNRDTDADLARAATIARGWPGIAEVARARRAAPPSTCSNPGWGAVSISPSSPCRASRSWSSRHGHVPDMARARAPAWRCGAGRHARRPCALARAPYRRGRHRVALAVAAVLLVLSATGLAVGFATSGAVATAREVVEVLHLMGADDAFIARLFARRSLGVGPARCAGRDARGRGRSALAAGR